MKKIALLLALAAAASMLLADLGFAAKKRRIDLKESDQWFGPAVKPPVNGQQIVIYGRTFTKKKRTAYERMMDHGDL